MKSSKLSYKLNELVLTDLGLGKVCGIEAEPSRGANCMHILYPKEIIYVEGDHISWGVKTYDLYINRVPGRYLFDLDQAQFLQFTILITNELFVRERIKPEDCLERTGFPPYFFD